MNERIFLRETDFYTRDLDPIKSYIEQTTFFISRMTGKDTVEAEGLVRQTLNRSDLGAKDPIVRFYRRDEHGDRNTDEIKLSKYISEVKNNRELLAPTFTSYIPHSKKRSFLVDFVFGNVKARSVAKKAAFKARAEGDMDQFILKDNEQTNKKLANNSVSGTFASRGTPLFNPSAHSTLTSITRTLSSIGNSNNEKLISGNRHYYSYDVTLNNLISIASSIDQQAFGDILDKYNLVHPSIDDVMDMIHYSSDLYWKNKSDSDKLRKFISRLTFIERAAVMYIGDLYHIRKLNPKFTRSLLEGFSRKIIDRTVEDPKSYLKTADDGLINLTHLICSEEVKGMGTDYNRMSEDTLHTLASTCEGLLNMIRSHDSFIREIFLSKNIPSSLANIKHQVRRSVVLSDTDSTMFSVDDYIDWYYGEMKFTPEAYALASSVMFLTTQCMSHLLAVFSANIGVDDEFIHTLAMKPEFSFKVFLGPQALSKHYIATIDSQEGSIFDKPRMEIKGVHLKSSATPKALVKKAHERMVMITEQIKTEGSVSLRDELEFIANIEKDIKASVLKGEVTYYRHTKIKTPEAYSNEVHQSPYLHHILWSDVFTNKYGAVDQPPYMVIKIPTILTNKTSLNAWIESIKDDDVKVRLTKFILKYNKTSLPTMYLNDDYVKAFGVPEEILPIVDTKRIILDLTNINRLTLESLGFSPKSGWTITELLNF